MPTKALNLDTCPQKDLVIHIVIHSYAQICEFPSVHMPISKFVMQARKLTPAEDELPTEINLYFLI